ncbi:unnamed protein product (macronuclear) [Paramecium tetraurelia]|uniref:Uncharacterized protein n=1 Tax=Paramecium tetraurelia TaxID=5888 RepID=A0CFB0_PARTE|nr:uncharacterized protein GSPATT00037916001 [Paramecium tetraurelia]CAK69477.1 unnamed protein product [Paramecium tetraurelia]|eukprot:XP_001436874.1 hypothetical protein (macronuclear) [Paramecium tetraurelia strain d4-2]
MHIILTAISRTLKPILEQDPLEARHTCVHQPCIRTIRNYCCKDHLRQCPRLQDYANDKERYTWCLTAMIPLLSREEQDPFKENDINQRWQKARIKIQQVE